MLEGTSALWQLPVVLYGRVKTDALLADFV